ncbi:hypothetical protein BH11PLA2_BH11PLA2_51800 [soil metagenome]
MNAIRPTAVKLMLESLSQRILPRNGLPVPDHVVIVVLENHAVGQILGSPNAPYLNSLVDGPNAALFTNSFGIEHPSQPNYLDLFSGTNQGVTGNTVTQTPFSTPNLGANLIAAGKSFVGYSEDLPAMGSLVTNSPGSDGLGFGGYWRKHNPWSNWQGSAVNGLSAASNQPFTSFPSNYSTLPTVSFVVPNQVHDMHDGSVAAADQWLSTHLNAYDQWAKTHNSVLIITTDEDDGSSGNQIFTLVTGQPVKQGRHEGRVDHFALLRTLEDLYDLPYAGASAQALPITDIWRYPAATGVYAVGSGPGSDSLNVCFADGTLRNELYPFPGFTGGVRTAVADFNNDGVADVIAGTGPGTTARVLILDGANPNQVLFDLIPFGTSFTGGVFVAAGDLTGDGRPDFAVSPDVGGGPRCRLFNGKQFSQIDDFFGIDDINFRGGARVAVGDIDHDGVGDLVVSAGFGGGPRIAGYSGKSLGSPTEHVRLFGDFFAFEVALRNGAYVALGDVNGDGYADLVVGAGPGGGPRVSVFDGSKLLQNQIVRGPDFFAGNSNARGGVRVSTKKLDTDLFADILTGDGQGDGGTVRFYDHTVLSTINPRGFSITAFSGFQGGLFVG